MKTILKFRFLVVVLFAISTSGVRSARAHFEGMHASARVMALGGAFAGIADDPAALIFNPAGLANIKTSSFLSTLIKPYGIGDLEESYFAAVVPTKIGKAGISWHRLSLKGVSAEDFISIGFGRDYIRTSQDASLSFGGTIDFARVSFGSPYENSKTIVTGSLGILLRPFPIIGLGYSIHNIIPGSFNFIPGGEGTGLERTHIWSLAYHWNRLVSVVFDRTRDQESNWKSRVGVEVRVLKNLRLRSGFSEGNVSGGAGIIVSNLNVDVGISSHEMLGLSYVLSIGYSFLGFGGKNHETH